ncbi:MAG: CotH kinase family protein [Fibrobacterales bacterium]
MYRPASVILFALFSLTFFTRCANSTLNEPEDPSHDTNYYSSAQYESALHSSQDSHSSQEISSENLSSENESSSELTPTLAISSQESSNAVQLSSSSFTTSSATSHVIPAPDTLQPVEAYDTSTDSEFLFSNTTLRTYNIIIDPNDLAAMDSDPIAEEYYPALLEFEDQHIENIQIRYKGNIGSWLYENTIQDSELKCIEGYEFIPITAPRSCQKLSLKLKFKSDAAPEQRFYGLKKLQFHAMNNDPSQIKERLGYWMFRKMGVIAPRSVHAIVTINGEPFGLYTMTDQVDSRFTRRNFSGGDGNLYKQIMPVQPDNKPWPSYMYQDALSTNEDTPETSLMESFAQAISAADSLSIKSVIELWMDVDQMMAHMLVNRVLRHWDSPWILMYQVANGKNYYWYEDTERQKFTLIPWDMEGILSAQAPFSFIWETLGWNGEPMTPLPNSPTPQECLANNNDPSLVENNYPQCNLLMYGFTLFEDEYRQQVAQFTRAVYPFISDAIDQWQTQITPATNTMNEVFGDPAPWPGYQYGRKGAISESYWLTHLDIVKSQVLEFAEEMTEY